MQIDAIQRKESMKVMIETFYAAIFGYDEVIHIKHTHTQAAERERDLTGLTGLQDSHSTFYCTTQLQLRRALFSIC